MDQPFDRRKFLKVSGMSLGVGALISVARTEAAPASLRRRISHRNSTPWWIGAAAAAALIIVIASTFVWRGKETTLEE